MKRETFAEVCVFALLITMGVTSRLASNMLEMYNFASVSAIAIFAGFYLSRTVVAALVPLTIMVVSHLFLPSYGNKLVLVGIYALLVAPVLLRFVLRRQLTALKVGLCAAGTSLFFFFGSNFVHWAFAYHVHTPASLVQCYVDALPFLKWTLLGDIAFSALLFGSYALAVKYRLLPAAAQQPASA